MNAARAREFLLGLPHVVEAEQWGGLLYWVGAKAIGGRTFTMLNLDASGGLPASFSVGPERFAELCEREGIVPAPYAARNFWVAVERWDALRDREWKQELAAAHALTLGKLPPKTRAILALPKTEQRRVTAERVKLLAAKEAAKKARG